MAQVLLVDDSAYQRIKMRKYLEAAGHEVVEGADGEQALEWVSRSVPDCMVLDLLMPKVGGMEVLRELRKKQLALPIIIHTSDIQEQTRQECLDLGAVAFLNKPSREADVLAVIAGVIQSKNQGG
jgi:twitching motility two-component system response regulator PilH